MGNRTKLIKQNINNFPQELQKVFHFMNISTSINLIGSSNYKNFLYIGDYDLNDYYKTSDTKNILNKIYENFRDKFIDAKKNPDMFITDFKCGEDDTHEPLRWNYKDIMKGYKIVDNTKYQFTDCVMHKSTMKLDMIYLYNGIATEISDNYFLQIKTETNYIKEDKKETMNKLVESYNEKIQEKNYFKALKRLFNIEQLEGHKSEKLIDLFNSDLGLLYNVISELKTIILLLEQTFKPIKLDIVKNNLQYVKYKGSKVIQLDTDDICSTIDKICKSNSKKYMINSLNKLCNELIKKLNDKVKPYLKKIDDK